MYVCVCQAVTESQIRQAAQHGARTLRDLRQTLGVTRDCGRCASCARACLDDARLCQGRAATHLLATA